MASRKNSLVTVFARSESGAAMVEYGVALGVILAITVAALPLIGGEVETIIRAMVAEFNALPN